MPGDLTTDTIEKRGDLYVLLSAEGEVLGEFDTQAAAEVARSQVKAAEAGKSFDTLMAEAIKSGQLPPGAVEAMASGKMKPVLIGPHNYSLDAEPYVAPDPKTDPVGAAFHKEVRAAMDELRPKLATTHDSEDWVDTLDFAPFGRVDSRDANGFMRVSATVTAPGVYAYVRNGKLRHELKPESEIFAPLHMESVHGAVVTDEHPAGGVAVTPENSKELQRGHSMSPPTRSAAGLDVDLVVTDAKLIEAAESKRKTGVSLGMRNTFDHSPGIWTAPDGSKHPYEVIQTNMVTNHIAIVSTPRVTSAQLHLDSLEQDETEETNMANKATLTFDGYDFETEPAIASVVKAQLGRRDDEIKALQVKLSEATTSYDSLTEEKDKLTAERDTAHAERDTAQAASDSFEEKLKTADSVDVDVLVTKRLAFLDRAKQVLTADKFEEFKGKSDKDIMRLTCDSLKIDLKDKSDAYIEARFDGLVDQAANTNDNALKNASLTMPPLTPTRESEHAEINKDLAAHYAN